MTSQGFIISHYTQFADGLQTSSGIIDYIGDFQLSYDEEGHCDSSVMNLIEAKACDGDINTNNPLLAVRTDRKSVV